MKKKLEWLWIPDGEKIFEDIFIRFGATHERDRHTDGHRVAAIAALCIASHGKNYKRQRMYCRLMAVNVKRNLLGGLYSP